MCGRYTVTIDKSTIEKRFGGRFYIAQALMTAYPVSPKMNKATFNEPAAIAPLVPTLQ